MSEISLLTIGILTTAQPLAPTQPAQPLAQPDSPPTSIQRLGKAQHQGVPIATTTAPEFSPPSWSSHLSQPLPHSPLPTPPLSHFPLRATPNHRELSTDSEVTSSARASILAAENTYIASLVGNQEIALAQGISTR